MKLGEIVEIIRGVVYNTGNTVDFKTKNIILTAENITLDGCFFLNKEIYLKDNLIIDCKKQIVKNDIFMCMSSGSVKHVGKCAFIDENLNKYAGGFMGIVRVKNNNAILSKYLYYIFNSIKFKMYVNKNTFGTNINNFINLEKYNINLPSLLVQEQIVEILDKVNSIIRLRKEQLRNIDLLIKSRFNEMFGDVVLNTKHWESVSGKNAFKFSSGLFLSNTEETESGYAVYGGNGIKGYTNKYLIDFDSLVIGRVGANCGNVKLIKGYNWITDNAIYIKEFKNNKFVLEYLYYYMNLVDFSNFSQKSGQPKITQKPLENYSYLVPPIELQKEFAEFVNKTNDMRKNIENSLNETEILRDALMQKYFG